MNANCSNDNKTASSPTDTKRGQCEVQIGGQDLEFRQYTLNDPLVTGRQLLLASGNRPVEEHIILQLTKAGRTEEVSLDETCDLRSSRIEKFVTFQTDRSYRLELDGTVLEWGAKNISGAALLFLAKKDPESHSIFLERRDRPDQEIGQNDCVDLNEHGVERLVTRPLPLIIIVNGRETRAVKGRLSFEELVNLAFPGYVCSPNAAVTVTFKCGPAENPEGSLTKGLSVHVKQGMKFNVTQTDKS